ncbi:hypothetical protein K1Y78_51365, partial [Streptomyces sp. tea 10]|nr:hypothetical protein [Streptomyces sp. tea 10]
YGPGRTSLIERVRTATPVTHRRVTNRIHRDDLVTVLSTVLDAPEPPRLLHAVDHDAAQLGDVVTHLAARLGVEVPPDNSPAGEGPLGKIIDGALVHSLVPRSRWRNPTFRAGVDAGLGAASAEVRDAEGGRAAREGDEWFVLVDWDAERTAQLCRTPIPREVFGQVPMSVSRAGEGAVGALRAVSRRAT